MPYENNYSLNNGADVSREEWEAYSENVNRSVAQLGREISNTTSDIGEGIKQDWVYHSPKLKKRATNLKNDLKAISDEVRERLTE